jgi:hypothetical protein
MSSTSARVVDPEAVGESSDEKSRTVRDQTIDSRQTSLPLVLGIGSDRVTIFIHTFFRQASLPFSLRFGFDLSESPTVEFEQAARERANEQPPAIFVQDGYSLRVTVGPAVTFKTFSIENYQPLRARTNKEFGVEEGDRGQIALRQPIERGVTPFHFSVFPETAPRL